MNDETWVKYGFPLICYITTLVVLIIAHPEYSDETNHIISFMVLLFGMLRGIILTGFDEQETGEN